MLPFFLGGNEYICVIESHFMKTPLYAILAGLLLHSSFSCSSKAEKPKDPKQLQTTQFFIDGLGVNEACPALFEEALQQLREIENLQIDCQTKKVVLSYNSNTENLETIALAIVTLKDGHTFKVYDMELIP